MTIHNVTDSALLVNKSRKTIQRYIANGKLNVSRDKSGHPQIDTAELERVFGKLSQVSHSRKQKNVAHELSQQKTDSRIDELLLLVKRLEKIVDKQSDQIASLLQSNHKAIKEQEHNVSLTEKVTPANALSKPKTVTLRKNNSYASKHGLPSNITEELHVKIMELSNQGLSGNKIADVLPVSKATINRVINISK